MPQLFSNNAETTLAAPLTDAATSVTFTDGSKFSAPTGGDYELLTLIAAGNIEIVRLTARTGNTGTITRAQESTTARAWVTGTRVFAGVTAGTLAAASGGLQNTADPGATGGIGIGSAATVWAIDGVAIGRASLADGNYSTAVGAEAEAQNSYAVSVGWRAVSQQYGLAVGPFCAANQYSVSLGANVLNSGTHSVTIGATASTINTGEYCTAVAAGASAQANYATAIGAGASATSDAVGGIAVGDTATARTRTMQVGALAVVPRNIKSGTDADAIWQSTGPQVVVMTAAKDLKTLASYTLALPTGVTFYPDEVGVIITAASGVTGQPTVRFGITADETKHLAATATTGLDAAYDRQRFATLLSDDGAKTLRAEVTVAATGTTLTGRFYWRGTAVSDT